MILHIITIKNKLLRVIKQIKYINLLIIDLEIITDITTMVDSKIIIKIEETMMKTDLTEIINSKKVDIIETKMDTTIMQETDITTEMDSIIETETDHLMKKELIKILKILCLLKLLKKSLKEIITVDL